MRHHCVARLVRPHCLRSVIDNTDTGNNRYPQHTISTPGTYTTPRQHHFSVNLSADIVVRSGVFATRAISRCCVAFVVRIRTSYALFSLSVGQLLAIASSQIVLHTSQCLISCHSPLQQLQHLGTSTHLNFIYTSPLTRASWLRVEPLCQL